jgi:O-succinylbenzoic acid--CoA ligase
VVALRGEPGVDLIAALHAIGRVGAAAFPLSEKAPLAELEPLLALADLRVGDLPGALPMDAEGQEPCPARDWPLEEVRLVVATSGTTGAAKPVPLTVSQLLFSAFGSAIRLGHLPGDRWILPLPLNHVGGLSVLLRCAWYATTVDLHPRFDPAEVDRAVEDGATLISVVPVLLERLLDHRGDRPFPPHLRCVLVGGAGTPEALAERCRRIGAPVALSWGMTEAASQVATRFPGELDLRGAPPMPFAIVRADEAGRLHVSGPLVGGGELATSDRGAIDGDGRVVVLGRVDDVFLSGGENVDPAEIEAALRAHPSVRDAAVVGVPDPTWGARPVAFLEGSRVDEAELLAWCRGRLSRFKVPVSFRWVDALPRNALGKVVRRALAEEPPAQGGVLACRSERGGEE